MNGRQILLKTTAFLIEMLLIMMTMVVIVQVNTRQFQLNLGSSCFFWRLYDK